MRKHRHFAVIIAVVMGAGLLAQRSATALSPTNTRHRVLAVSAVRPRPGPGLVHIDSVAARSASRPAVDPLLALTTAVTRLTSPPPPPPAPSPPPAAAPSPPPAAAPAGGPWAELRQCESGDDYGEDTGNGYYGAYQFSLSTWEGLGYGGLPSEASPAVQDQAAQRLQARSGWGQWPVCSRRLGLD